MPTLRGNHSPEYVIASVSALLFAATACDLQQRPLLTMQFLEPHPLILPGIYALHTRFANKRYSETLYDTLVYYYDLDAEAETAAALFADVTLLST